MGVYLWRWVCRLTVCGLFVMYADESVFISRRCIRHTRAAHRQTDRPTRAHRASPSIYPFAGLAVSCVWIGKRSLPVLSDIGRRVLPSYASFLSLCDALCQHVARPEHQHMNGVGSLWLLGGDVDPHEGGGRVNGDTHTHTHTHKEREREICLPACLWIHTHTCFVCMGPPHAHT